MIAEFDRYFREWVSDACSRWGQEYPQPPPEYYEKRYVELPEVIQSSVVAAIQEGLVVPKGMKFQVKDGRRGLQGPYSWFSKNREPRPCPNREYFVQVAEFLRFHHIGARNNLKAFFEFDAMDISLYGDGNRVVLICETKVNRNEVQNLLVGMKRFERGIDYSTEDLRVDSLRKAKYIQTWRPDYFCTASTGNRRVFRVTYGNGYLFQLKEEDRLPWE